MTKKEVEHLQNVVKTFGCEGVNEISFTKHNEIKCAYIDLKIGYSFSRHASKGVELFNELGMGWFDTFEDALTAINAIKKC